MTIAPLTGAFSKATFSEGGLLLFLDPGFSAALRCGEALIDIDTGRGGIFQGKGAGIANASHIHGHENSVLVLRV